MPRRSWRLWAEDILQALETIHDYTRDMDRDDFIRDRRTIDAVLRNLIVVGEASRKMPAEVQQANPQIPWQEMSDMRNVVVHEYFGVSVPIIWDTIERDLPPLIPAFRRLLDESE